MAIHRNRRSYLKGRICLASLLISFSVFSSSGAGTAISNGFEDTAFVLMGEDGPSDKASVDERVPCAAVKPAADIAPGKAEPEEIFDAVFESFENQEARLFVNGRPYPFPTAVHGSELYVRPAQFLEFAGCEAVVSWEEGYSHVVCGALEIEAVPGELFICANGRNIWCEDGVFEDPCGVTVPLSSVSAAIGFSSGIAEDGYFASGEVSPIESGDEFYDGEDLLWLSRIISCESRYESFLGKIAVGNVVLNRVESPDFPGDVYGVVFDCRFGIVQFSPVAGGHIYCDPDPESVNAAKLCLEGVTLSDEIMYFMNPDLSTTSWISDNRDLVMTIGNHSFYS